MRRGSRSCFIPSCWSRLRPRPGRSAISTRFMAWPRSSSEAACWRSRSMSTDAASGRGRSAPRESCSPSRSSICLRCSRPWASRSPSVPSHRRSGRERMGREWPTDRSQMESSSPRRRKGAAARARLRLLWPSAPSSAPLARKIAVRFDSNVAGGLPWKFEPEQTEIEINIGQVVTVYYNVTNQSARTTTGQAAYNVAPLTVGAYFQKINCFCFTEQTMGPGEKREMPVVFYVDPALVKDSDNDGLNTITLSYTFYPVREQAPKPVAAGETEQRRGPPG